MVEIAGMACSDVMLWSRSKKQLGDDAVDNSGDGAATSQYLVRDMTGIARGRKNVARFWRLGFRRQRQTYPV